MLGRVWRDHYLRRQYSGQTQTLPLALFSLTEAPGNDMAAARLAVIGVALAMIALLTSEVMARRIGRRLGRQTRYSP